MSITSDNRRYAQPSTYIHPLTRKGHANTQPEGPGGIYGGRTLLQMDDVVVETVVTHITRTRTIYPPLAIPSIPPIPTTSEGLSPTKYPLADQPIPDSLRSYPLIVNGQRMLLSESGAEQEEKSLKRGPGRGWKKLEEDDQSLGSMDRISATNGLSQFADQKNTIASPSTQGNEDTTRLDFVLENRKATHRPPASTCQLTPAHSQLSSSRKRAREDPETTMISPQTTPDESVDGVNGVWPYLNGHNSAALVVECEDGRADQQGSSSVATLCALPDLVNSFDILPDKLQQHVLVQLMRRIRQPSIQVIADFLLPATKRDFIGALPREVASQIISHLVRPDAVSASAVCWTWKRVIEGDRRVWKENMIRDGLWTGKDEDEEEMMIQRRWQVSDERWEAYEKSSECNVLDDHSSDFEMHSPENEEEEGKTSARGPTSVFSERPASIKTLYRQRYTDRKAWFTPEVVSHTQFAGLGTNVITRLQFDRDRIVCSSDDHSLNVYTLDGQATRLDGHEGGVWALQYRGDILVTGSTDKTVRVWDLETKKQTHLFLGHTSTVRCLQIVEPVLDEATGEWQPPCPLFVTGSRDNTLRVWRLPKKGEHSGSVMAKVTPVDNPFHLMCLEGHTQPVRALATHGRFCASGSYDNTVRIWDLITGACLHVLQGHNAKVYSVAIDRYRNRCISGDLNGVIHVWDMQTGTCLTTLTGHTTLVGLISVSPNLIVTAAADSSLRIWDAETNTFKQHLAGHMAAITCFQHDETKVISGSDGCLKLWNAKTGEFVRDLVTGVNNLWQAGFKDDLCVSASNRNGTTMFDVFRFGTKGTESKADKVGRDVSLDLEMRPRWESVDRTEPYEYHDRETELIPRTPPRKRGHFAKAIAPPRLPTRKR